MSKNRKLMFSALFILEVVLLLAMPPTTIPQNRKAKALFTKWQQSHSEADEAAFHAEMARVMVGQRKRQKIAGMLFVANSVILVVVWKRKDRIDEKPQQRV